MEKRRILILKIAVAVMMIAIIARLFSLQIIRGETYKEMSVQRVTTTTVEKAPRGEILDRYGRPLITNRTGYSLKMQKTGLKSAEFNKMMLDLLNVLEECGYTYEDSLPITFAPYEFDFEDENGDMSAEDEKAAWFEKRKKITDEMSAEEIIEYYKKNVYNIGSEFTEDEARKIIGIRYDQDINGLSATNPFTLAEDVDMNVVTKIKERADEFPGIYISTEYFRKYEYETLAAHILGGIGKMNKEEYELLKDNGYGYNDVVGKRGIEKVCEEYLKGIDGKKNVMKDPDDESDITLEDISAVPGNYVTLTIDSELQKAAEESLEKRIKELSANGTGADAGAAVVIDVSNGDVLACANYPTYTPENFNKDYDELAANTAKPIWNRAISGTYTPGSTLKPLTAIAALESGAVTADEKIKCDGIYDFYDDYKPKCWIWSSQHKTHGELNVTGAIENSCNCYFYEVGRRCGIETMDEYAKMYGLGEVTGIELSDEAKGNMSSPEYKEKIAGDYGDKKWYAGDVIQTAIGQSYSAFTPIQLANYIAAIANNGILYKTHIIKSVRSSENGQIVKETQSEVLNTINVSSETLEVVKKGMYGVVDEGSASAIFKDYPIGVGGKTGTAQVGKNKSDNALFVAFAPYDNPQIAVAVAVEKGEKGYNAAYIARDIFDEYFGLNENKASLTKMSELLP